MVRLRLFGIGVGVCGKDGVAAFIGDTEEDGDIDGDFEEEIGVPLVEVI